MSRDLGERPIELTWTKVQDIDLTTGLTTITDVKHTIGIEGILWHSLKDFQFINDFYIAYWNPNELDNVFGSFIFGLVESHQTWHALFQLFSK